MDISDLRKEIDAVDAQLAALLTQRMDISKRIAVWKKENGRPALDTRREREKLAALTSVSREDMAQPLRVVYSLLFELSRAEQNTLLQPESIQLQMVRKAIAETPQLFPERAHVACQGVEGAYSTAACEKLFRAPEITYLKSFDGVFSAIASGLCDYGVLPIENSTAGSVTQVYDLMEKYHFYIVGAQRLRIDHRLMRKNGASDTPIREVVSHEQALRQCGNFLASQPQIKATVMENTAVAAEYVAKSDRDDLAVIASRACADLYGLDIVKEDISNSPNNYTRFICISRRLEIYPHARKISLMLNLAHEPGALNAVVSRLAIAGINLLKLESRPLPGREFEFRFFFDMTACAAEPEVIRLLGELEAHCDRFTFLGCYDEN